MLSALSRGLGGNKCHEADSDLLCPDPGPWGQAPDQANDSADLEIHLCLSDPRRIKRRKKPFLTLKGYGTLCMHISSVCSYLLFALCIDTQYFGLTNLNFKFVLKPVSPSC